MNKYWVVGVAFEGDPFNYITESDKSMLDFVIDDVNELVGGDRDYWDDMNIMWVRPTKVLIEGHSRIYLIEQI